MPKARDAALAEIRALQAANWPEQVPRDVAYPVEVPALPDYLRHWATTRPDTIAISFYGRDITYAEYDELSDRFAGWLAGRGVAPGHRVGVFLGNCPQFLIAMAGILKAGAVHVPINPMFRGHELRYELDDAGVTVLLAQDALADVVEAVRDGSPVRHVAYTGLADLLTDEPDLPVPFARTAERSDWAEISSSARAQPRPCDPDAPAALNYTGGTTGMPKGCEHTQRHMVYTAATATLGGGTEVGAPDVVSLNFLPVFWIAGEDFGILNPLVNGQQVVLMTRWDPAVAADLVGRHGVTDMVATVDNYVELLELPGFDGTRLSSLRNALAVSFVLTLTPEIRARWRAATGTVLREASYGMTETHTADTFTLGFQDDDRDLHTDPVFCGLPVPGTDILIVDEAGEPVPVGVPGEIIVRSPSILTGYHGRPDATAETIRDGWLHTGDVGRLDEWGALHYLARTKEMIKTNGMSVFPSEIESLLRLHPAIRTVSVVPRPDRAKGQVAVAFVEVADDATTGDELHSWARDNMAAYKVPEFEIVAQLPMTATGKIRKGDLFDRAAELAAARDRA
ncbi:AMP-binding protein [Pseudonocardia kunmingensis]|uniref:Fatty-acyl-CoA synthase/long-chain acyl-CoA synthetase n=1 Tax=Pseudonocardia kunmingensis TaxID=630975 RepID=A0A543CY84_9PSEU|nr:AMP-binding protein [Pseudonocardia kunmingensis]TQM01828.1 fatty-acyl-CoA synthase/long-chain acyl-CoA synthetase [Pseudonocardia kunmingensis]